MEASSTALVPSDRTIEASFAARTNWLHPSARRVETQLMRIVYFRTPHESQNGIADGRNEETTSLRYDRYHIVSRTSLRKLGRDHTKSKGPFIASAKKNPILIGSYCGIPH